MRADMHLHSRYSDGSLWPDRLAQRAATAGLEAACLTDHDTFGGTLEFIEAARSLGMASWPAAEIDCADEATGYRSEILAYFPKGSYAKTKAFLDGIRAGRNEGVRDAVDRASRFYGRGALDFAAVVRHKTERHPGVGTPDPEAFRLSKVDIYRAMLAAGLVAQTTGYPAFKRAFFDTGLFSDMKFPKPSVEEVAAAVLADGGSLVVPHIGHEFDDDPSALNRSGRLDSLLSRFRELGVAGVELYAYGKRVRDGINDIVRQRAEALGFLVTYGSDFHAPVTGRHRLGAFHGDFAGFPG